MVISLQALAEERIILLDGATGTGLMERGLAMGECPERWNLEYPERVSDLHRSYYEAGSDMVLTNTFGGNRLRLACHGLQGRMAEINARGVQCARQACPEGAFVGGDMGPSGVFLTPRGPHEPEELTDIFEEQARVLCDSGADILFIETMYDLREALVALESAKKTGLPVAVSMTFTRKGTEFSTLSGDTPLTSLSLLKEKGAWAVGSNCSLASNDMVPLFREIESLAPFPLVVKPNAGQPRIEGGKAFYEADCEEFSKDLLDMSRRGARMLGGCCGTTPLFISALSSWVKR